MRRPRDTRSRAHFRRAGMIRRRISTPSLLRCRVSPSHSVRGRLRIAIRTPQQPFCQTGSPMQSRELDASALVSLVEKGRRTPSLQFAEGCDRVLDTDGALTRLWPLVSRAYYPRWFRGFVELEATATAIRSLEPLLIPGLLQTPDYARAVLKTRMSRSAPDDLAPAVAARIARQHLLSHASPPLCWFILDEAVLRRPIGSREVMRAQFSALLDGAESPNIVL